MNFTIQWSLLVELIASVVSVRMAHYLGVRDYRLRITDYGLLQAIRNPFFLFVEHVVSVRSALNFDLITVDANVVLV